MHTDHWDPFLRACEETETVVCLHNGSSSWTAARSPGAPLELYTSLFPVNALVTAADWLWAQRPDPLPEHQDRVLGGRHQLGADADRPHRLRARPLRGRLARLGRPERLADRRAAPQLLVLHDRHRLDVRAARPHRHRPHLHRERLSARRLDVARHAGARARRARRVLARRSPQGHVGERVEAVPPSRARRSCRSHELHRRRRLRCRRATRSRGCFTTRGRQRSDPRVPEGARRVSGRARRRACSATACG